MKASINGRIYDTEQAEWQSTFLTHSGGEHRLYRTPVGEFFIALEETVLDGRRLAPTETLESLAPELCEPTPDIAENEPDFNEFAETQPDPGETRLHWLRERARRVASDQRILPVSDKEALRWCIQTQIPDCFKGYLLDCL